jgi:hypothetical protein
MSSSSYGWQLSVISQLTKSTTVWLKFRNYFCVNILDTVILSNWKGFLLNLKTLKFSVILADVLLWICRFLVHL